MNLKPLLDKVLVLVDPAKRVTDSGIQIAGTPDQKQWSRGTVSGIGPECDLHTGSPDYVPLKEGDAVLFNRPWDGLMISDNGSDYFVLEKKDIMCVDEAGLNNNT